MSHLKIFLLLLPVILLASYTAATVQAGSLDAAPYDAPYSVRSVLSRQRQDLRSYGWPVKPFDRQHVVRAYLNDPRIYGTERSFHFGIDINVPPGSPVYAVEAGRAHRINRWAVSIRGTGRSFAYWHIVPLVGGGRWVARHALIGHTRSMFNHVHLAEYRAGHYVNPLRRGGIGPFRDHTAPTVERLTFRRTRDLWLEPAAVKGTLDLVLDVCDPDPGVEHGLWPVVPVLVRWRLFRGTTVVAGWRTAVDFARWQLPMRRFDSIFAFGTRQNKPGRPGEYCFYLARRWNSKRLRDGIYRLEATASDVRGNIGSANFAFRIAN